MTFRFKTVLTIVVLTALALGGAFTAVSAAFNRLQRTQLDASLLRVAEQEAREAPLHRFSFTDGPGPAANDVGPLTKYGIIYHVDGRVLSATPPFDQKPPALARIKRPPGQAFDIRFEGSHFRGVFVSIPAHPGKLLFLATSRDDLDGDEAFLHRAMVVAFLVAVLWVAAVARWMGGRLTLAHRDIASVVRRVTQGDLSARVKVAASDPQVERLGRDINEMVARLDELLKSQQRFIAYAAHELRTPLAALFGELQQARRKQRGLRDYEETIDAALSAARHLTMLAEDLLTLAGARAKGDEPR
ncbi:MAG: Osmosensitive channel histidine kinase KdpD, partial [Polyangiaceae bacterium]|nr:Osmosensitive channel histidine kinase KdpD [Polyangiaceae bacterium]